MPDLLKQGEKCFRQGVWLKDKMGERLFYFPDFDGAIETSTSDGLAIRSKHDPTHIVLMAFECLEVFRKG